MQDFKNQLGSQKLTERIAVENSLNSVTFLGVGLGAVIQNRLNLYVFKNLNYTKKEALKTSFQLWAGTLSKFRPGNKSPKLRDVAVVYYSGAPKDKAIFKDVLPQLESGSYSESLKTDFFPAFGFKELGLWLSNIFKFRREAAVALKKLQAEKYINTPQRIVLMHLALCYCLRVAKIHTILQAKRPKLMLFSYDRDPLCGLVAATAKAMGIRSAVIVHGSTFHLPTGFVPVLCDDLLCWGDLQREMFSYYGSTAESIVLTGFPKFRDVSSMNRVSLLQKFNFSEADKVFLLATSPLKGEKDSELKVIESFLAAFSDVNPVLRPVIKLHPTRYDYLLPKIKAAHPEAFILPNDITTDNSLLLADVVVNLTSTFGIEALAANRPVLVFNPTQNAEEGIGGLLKTHASSRYALTSGELNVILHETDNQTFEKVFNKTENLNYFKKICSFTDVESVRQIVAYINRVITKTE